MNLKSTSLFIIVTSFISCQETLIPEGGIPIDFNGHVYLKGAADGVEGDYIFDTGARNLYLDKIHYTENNFKHKNTYEADLVGVGTTPKIIDVIEDTVTFKFGSHLYTTPNVPILELKQIVGDKVDGIIGMDYFQNSILEINYEDEFIKKYSSQDSINFEGFSKIKLTVNDNGLTLPLKLDIDHTTSISGEFQLDVGNGGALNLTSLVSSKYELNKRIENKVSNHNMHNGAGGESTSEKFIASAIEIGGFKIPDVVMSFSNDTLGAMATNEYLGLLGNKILERFHVFIDFANNNLYLKPNHNFGKPFDLNRLGFNYVDRVESLGAWTVNGLYSPSNAEKSGLKVGDKIISVNEIEVHNIPFEKQKEFFKKIDAVNFKVVRDDNIVEIDFRLQEIITRNKNN